MGAVFFIARNRYCRSSGAYQARQNQEPWCLRLSWMTPGLRHLQSGLICLRLQIQAGYPPRQQLLGTVSALSTDPCLQQVFIEHRSDLSPPATVMSQSRSCCSGLCHLARVCLFIQVFNDYLLRVYYMPDTVLGTETTAVNTEEESLSLQRYSSWRRQTGAS